jgi:5'-deoxynucleotidase YfbR-like HD superfamily hydrolase
LFLSVATEAGLSVLTEPDHESAVIPAAAAPVRAWQRMLSGRRLDLLDPAPADIELDDIAHGLARVARWNGQTTGPHVFSVAQHSLLVETIAAELDPGLDDGARLAALLHDAPEYVIGDMISPFKAALGVDYKAFEERLEAAIHIRFGLPPKTPANIKTLIKAADHVSAFFEATQLAGFAQDEALGLFGRPPAGLQISLKPVAPFEAQARFVDRFNSLLADLPAPASPPRPRGSTPPSPRSS